MNRAYEITVAPISGALGAEIYGVRLNESLSDEVVARIRAALLEHLVVFFRDQTLTPAQFQDFAEKFGEPVEYPMIGSLEGYPKITPVIKLAEERINFGGIWHTDTTYLEHPPLGTMLLAQELPPYGGDTLFANQYLAYEALSPTMQKLLEPLVGMNTSTKATASRTREDRLVDTPHQEGPREFSAEHPVVRTHPETGRKALYVNLGHTERFKGMSEEESASLLQFLFTHQIQPQFTCRFRWAPGSLAFWDNRAAQHNAVNDYHGHRRVMHRVTLKGDRPRGAEQAIDG